MKYLILLPAFLFLLHFTACQENGISDPVSTNGTETSLTKNISSDDGKIKLNTYLTDPSQGPNGKLKIYGSVFYKIDLTVVPNNSVELAYNTVLKLKIDAILENIDPSDGSDRPAYRVEDVTFDYLFINQSNDEVKYLVKNYPVIGRTDKMFLKCTYVVSSKSVALKSMELCYPVRINVGNNVAY